MEIEFNLKDLMLFYKSVSEEIISMSKPIIPFEERMLQFNPTREKERNKNHIEMLKDNKVYQHLLDLKDKLENITIKFNIEKE